MIPQSQPKKKKNSVEGQPDDLLYLSCFLLIAGLAMYFAAREGLSREENCKKSPVQMVKEKAARKSPSEPPKPETPKVEPPKVVEAPQVLEPAKASGHARRRRRRPWWPPRRRNCPRSSSAAARP